MIQKPNAKQYFRSFEALVGDPQLEEAFGEAIEHDFGAAAPSPGDGLSRRRWLQLMGASMAFGSMLGCRMGKEEIAPFVFRPHNRIPGIPEKYATSVEFGGIGKPLLATSVDGRPIKLDGNPDHPNCNHGSDAFTQAMILDLYDPDRSRNPRIGGRDANWEELLKLTSELVGTDGTGVAVLSEPTVSPTINRLKTEFLEKYPQAKWFEFTSLANDNELAGTKLAFGKPMRQRVLYDRAKIIVTLEADPIGIDANAPENARRFAAGRDADAKVMNRLYSVESKFTTTGSMADHHLPLRLSQMGSFVSSLEQAIDGGEPISVGSANSKREKIFAAMVSDLLAHRGDVVLVCGYRLSPEIQAQVCRINHKLGSYDATIEVQEAVDAESTVEQISKLAGEIAGAKVQTLLVFGGNPVYAAPADLRMAETLSRVTNSIHFGLYFDETAAVCGSHGNLAHALESWGDYRGADGSWLVAQPLIEPLFGAKSPLEILAHLVGESPARSNDEVASAENGQMNGRRSAMEHVRVTAESEFASPRFVEVWNQAVHDGFFKDSANRLDAPELVDFTGSTEDTDAWKSDWDSGDLELVFIASGHVFDGRFANNGWLQELPDFLTKLTWDNAAHVSPKTARVLGLKQGMFATFDVEASGNSVKLPVNILPGMANGSVAVELGYGRTKAGRVGGNVDQGVAPVGHNVGVIRTTQHWNSAPAVKLTRSSTKYRFATTQEHFRMDKLGQNEINRRTWGDDGDAPLVREGTYADYMDWLTRHDNDHGPDESHGDDHDHGDHHGDHHGPPRWPSDRHLHFKNVDISPRDYDLDVGHKWGMSIDLNKCIGCNACVIACQAENNIPIVGKDQVARGRELHWMRIDRYFVASEDDVDAENIAVVQQPVACQHCEKAPCETVCPVAATVHSREGLNDMVYNRCIGTRYCGNNCPYKVRRFNYFNYSEERTFVKYPNEGTMSEADRQLQNLMMNPEVTVRSRGVMEKCTYCVQRIQNTKILAKNEKRELRDNEILVACQQACPSEAIEFGDLHRKQSRLVKAHENPRSYTLLEEMNNYPRTKYLARVRNPHPDLEGLFKPWEADRS